MSFTLLPAFDVTTDNAHGALDTTLGWQAEGATWIHLVDLDAAFGRGSNADVLATVIGRLDIDVELSAAVRDDASLAWALATGCRRVIVGTAALADRGWCAQAIATHGDRIAVALDVRADRLEARGGSGADGDLWETLAWLDEQGCARYVVTDVGRDGALTGPNLDLYAAVAAATSAPLVASGGVATFDDLLALADTGGVEGSIVGSALHALRFTLPEALAVVRDV